MSGTILFLGPTLDATVARSMADVDVRPPAQLGDINRAIRESPSTIAIVDGFYERVPAIWHREILAAMAAGITVYGASSMGALRAAELAPFGMRGVGRIFEWFASGALTDDDEVAIVHAPRASGYLSLSVAMVNIRASLDAAVRDGVLGADRAASLIAVAKSEFYPDRTWEQLGQRAGEAGLRADEWARLETWLVTGAVDQKRDDALELLRVLADRPRDVEPRPASFDFEHTAAWELLLSTESSPPAAV